MFNAIALMGPFTSAYTQSDVFGKLIMLGLVFLSVLCWVVLLYKIWLTRQVGKLSRAFFNTYEQHKDQILHLELKPSAGRQVPHPFQELFRALQAKSVEILNKNRYFSNKEKSQVHLSSTDLEIIESYALTTISSQTKILEKNLYILSTIMTLAPFLGLLGTVWGILVTFSELHAGGTAGSNTAVLGGLSTALVTTVLGLVIAIPALISYNYLKVAIKNYSSDMEDFLYELLSTIELQYRKVE